MLLFLGLIIGTVPIIYKSHDNMSFSPIKGVCFAIPFILLSLTAILPESAETAVSALVSFDYMMLVLSGVVAMGAMIVPGLSGSFILLLLGTYHVILNAVLSVNVLVVSLVALGALFGGIIFTKGIYFCLKKYPAYTYYVILGLLLGSVATLWPGSGDSIGVLGVNIIVFLLGWVVAVRLA
jgi:putative membrane protein